MKINKLFIILFITIFGALIPLKNLNAASATISVSANKNQVIVGDNVTVTVKISSSDTLGSWKWTIDYDSSKLKLTSGETTVGDPGDGVIKSKSYTYVFKALSTGSTTIGVRNVDVLNWSEQALSVSKGSKSIKIITKSDYQNSLSKDNDLSSLSVSGLKLDPDFSKGTTEYKVEASANTNEIKIEAKASDSRASIDGVGTFPVTEGENKFTISVTAQNGSVKKYTVVVNVIDPNPINVKIDGKDYVVVKREANLKAPESFEKAEIVINEQKIPGFYNDINKWTIVGLKDSEGNIDLFIYDKNNNSYKKYTEVVLEQVKLYPLEMDKEIENFTKSNTIIDNTNFESLKTDNGIFSVIHARNLDTGLDNYYLYDSITNTLVTYTDEFVKPYKEKITEYKKLIIILIGETIVIVLILIGILINKLCKNKKKKELLMKEKLQNEEKNLEDNQIKEDNIKEVTEDNKEEIDIKKKRRKKE